MAHDLRRARPAARSLQLHSWSERARVRQRHSENSLDAPRAIAPAQASRTASVSLRAPLAPTLEVLHVAGMEPTDNGVAGGNGDGNRGNLALRETRPDATNDAWLATRPDLAGRPHVVIVGGGFGGLRAARELASAEVRITLVDRQNHHLFQPLLYQVAMAGLSP